MPDSRAVETGVKDSCVVGIDRILSDIVKYPPCEVNRRSHALRHEESPGTAEQGCRLTAGGGDSRESATEIYR